MRTRSWRGWGVFGLTLVLAAAGLVLTLACGHIALPHGANNPLSLAAGCAVIGVPFAAVGGLLIVRRPENAIGPLFGAMGLLFGLAGFSNGWCAYTVYGGGELPAAGVMAWFATCGVTIPLFVGPLVLLLLFPTGHLLSPRWRPVAVGAAVFAVAELVAATTQPGPWDGWPELANPFALSGAAGRAVTTAESLLGVPFCVLFLAAATCLVLRFRRARGLERLQIKWVVYAACVTAGAFSVSISSPSTRVSDDVFWVGLAGLAGMPVAAGMAILRYRLYEIDRVINRTLVYAQLTACLVAVYVGAVLLLEALLGPITSGSHLAVAVSTLVVAAIFGPARARIQRWVDHRFYRRRYDAARTLEAFSAQLRDEVDLDALAEQLHAAVSETMQPERVTLWLRPAPGQRRIE